jgi:hypothetical protein
MGRRFFMVGEGKKLAALGVLGYWETGGTRGTRGTRELGN